MAKKPKWGHQCPMDTFLVLFYLTESVYLYFRGGKICLTDHFKPLWARNVPKFGIAHAMALGVCVCFVVVF